MLKILAIAAVLLIIAALCISIAVVFIAMFGIFTPVVLTFLVWIWWGIGYLMMEDE